MLCNIIYHGSQKMLTSQLKTCLPNVKIISMQIQWLLSVTLLNVPRAFFRKTTILSLGALNNDCILKQSA